MYENKNVFENIYRDLQVGELGGGRCSNELLTSYIARCFKDVSIAKYIYIYIYIYSGLRQCGECSK